MIWTDLAFGLHYMGLNLGKNEFGLQFFWLGHDLGRALGPNLVGLNGAQQDGSGLREKKSI